MEEIGIFLEPLIPILAALVGIFAGWLLSNETSRSMLQRQEFIKAVIDFRAAFTPTLVFIRFANQPPLEDISATLKQYFQPVTIAMETYRFYIPSESLSGYDAACEKYKAIMEIRFFNYKELGGDKPLEIIEEHINAILSYAPQRTSRFTRQPVHSGSGDWV